MTLTIGELAPDFTLPATSNQNISLHDFKGKNVVLYFYPKDDTPGCTTEACDFRDNMALLQDEGVVILGVSKDSVASHEKFKEKYKLNFPLLSDEAGEMLNAYGVWMEKSMMGKKYMGIDRSTFLIDANGKIAAIWRNVKVQNHVKEILAAIQKRVA